MEHPVTGVFTQSGLGQEVTCSRGEKVSSRQFMYGRFRNAIENVNVVIATYNDALMGNVHCGLRQRSARISTWSVSRRSTRRRWAWTARR